MDLEIKVADLREITNRIFDHVQKDLKVDAIRLTEDYYWDVPSDRLYDMANKPTELDCGQLYDDWEFLSHILRDKDQAVSLMLIHLAPLLRHMGLKVGQ